LLLIDFEKAFDSLEWDYIYQTLEAYNFGPVFQKWIKILYKGAASCVINNGHFSEFFHLEKGCRQGDPLSPYLFILSIEPLSVKIKNSGIKGIKIGKDEYIIGQYADDTFILMDGSEQSFKLTIKIFEHFSLCSGLKMNIEKTKAVWLGAGARDRPPICPEMPLQWSRNFELLGIKFMVDNMEDIVRENLEEKLVQVQKLINGYKRRNLTIMGKITVVKCLAISKLIHVLSVLPAPSRKFVKKFNAIISEFIWNTKTGKINRNLMAQDMDKGGLKVTHLETLMQALKVKWVKDVLQEKHGWVSIFTHCAGKQYNSGMWQLDELSLLRLKSKIVNINAFWADMIGAWAKLVKTAEEPKEILNYSLESAYYINNKNIKTLQPILHRKGVCLIRDLLNDDGNPLDFNDFKRKYEVNVNFMDYVCLIKSVPKDWFRIAQTSISIVEARETTLIAKIKKTTSVCKWAYQELIKTLPFRQPYKEKWTLAMTEIREEDWLHYHSLPFRCTKNTRLQAFQYKVTHNILTTQRSLKRYRLSDSDTCTYCNGDVETIQHVLFRCPTTRQVWNEFEIWLRPVLEIGELITEKSVIMGSFSNDIINLLMLIVKYSCYVAKFKKELPNINSVKRAIKYEYELEKK